MSWVSPPTLRDTPPALILTTVSMLVVILALDLEMLVKTASPVMILLLASVNVSVVLMRESRVLSYKPKFRAPLYPWTQLVGVVAYGFLLLEMGTGALLIAGAFLLVSLLWYWVHGRILANRVSALAHVVRRLTAEEMRYDVLNSELRQILLERDEIVEDSLDQLVREARVLDIRIEVSFDSFLDRVSDALADETELDTKTIRDLLREREDESSTVIGEALAVPHLIIPGQHQFKLMLLRCRNGVSFPEHDTPVKAVFVLAGTADERTFHLKALMGIAQIVQAKDFMPQRLDASGEDGLRDFVLLSERKRDV